MMKQDLTLQIYLYVEDLNEAIYQFLIKKHENVETKHFHDTKIFIEYSNDMVDIYKSIEEYNANKKRKIEIVSNDMIARILLFGYKKLHSIVTELFIRGRKLSISLVLIT